MKIKRFFAVLVVFILLFSIFIPIFSSTNYFTSIRKTPFSVKPKTVLADPLWYQIENQPDDALNIIELWIGKKEYLVNSVRMESDVAPIIKNNRTLVPIRIISEGLGASVDWNGQKREVTITLYTLDGTDKVVLFIDNKTYYINDTPFTTDVPPQIINSRTMVPIRVVSESLKCKVYWSPIERKVTVKALKLFSDADNDSLTFEVEYKYHTNPNNPDTDGDGLTDGEEVKVYHTDPLKADTDGDGLTDGEEVKTYHTDPLKAEDFSMYKKPDMKLAFNEGVLFPADVNSDFRIDENDFNLVKRNISFNTSVPYNPIYDINKDGIVDEKDLAIVRINESDKPLIEKDIVKKLDKLSTYRKPLIKFVFSKVIANKLSLDSDSVKTFVSLLADNVKNEKSVSWIINNGFCMEDGKLDLTETEILKSILKNGVENVDENLILQQEKIYAERMDKKIPGMGNEVKSILSKHDVYELEALEDIYGQVMRSVPYKNTEDRFDKNKIAIESEMYDAFTLITKHGNPERENEINIKRYEDTKKKADRLVLDGRIDDWLKEGIEPHTRYKDMKNTGVPLSAAVNQVYVAEDTHDHLWIFLKTQAEPDLSKYIYNVEVSFGDPTKVSLEIHITSQGIQTNSSDIYFKEMRYKIGKDGIEIELSKTYTIKNKETKIDTNMWVKPCVSYSNTYQTISCLWPVTKLFPGIIYYPLPDKNTQLYLMENLCSKTELKPYDLIGTVLPITESAIYNLLDDYSQKLFLPDMVSYYFYMNKFEKRDLFLDLNLLSRQNLDTWDWALPGSKKLHPVFYGFKKKLNKYDYWYNFVFTNTIKKLGKMYKDYKSDPNKIEIAWQNLHEFSGYRNYMIRIYDRTFYSLGGDCTNIFLQLWEKYEAKYTNPACGAIEHLANDSMRSLGIVPFKLTMTKLKWSRHAAPAYYDVNTGKLVMSEKYHVFKKSGTFLVDIPSINGIQMPLKVVVANNDEKAAYNFMYNGIYMYGDNGLKKMVYGKWFGNN